MSPAQQQIKLSNAIVFLVACLTVNHNVLGQASTDQLSNVQSQYDALSLSSAYPDGFGIPLKAAATMNVAYPSGNVQLGKAMSASDVSTLPTITITPSASAANAFKAPNSFTLMLADANALGNPDKQGNYRHFLENGATFGDPTGNGMMTLNAGSGTVVTAYAGPGPLPNEGPHRYAWLLFVQPSAFKAPANLSEAGTGPGHWYVNAYVSNSGLGDLVAASFFTVENGHASFAPRPTAVSNSSTASTNTTSASPIASTGASKSNAQSPSAGGPAWMNFADLVKGIITGLGVAFCGYVLVQ